MKRGNPLTTSQARKIAESGAIAWCELIEYADPNKNYSGPVIFSTATVGYYVEPVDGTDEGIDEAVSDLLSSVIINCAGFNVVLTDFDPDEFEDDEVVYIDFGDGTFALYEAAE